MILHLISYEALWRFLRPKESRYLEHIHIYVGRAERLGRTKLTKAEVLGLIREVFILQ